MSVASNGLPCRELGRWSPDRLSVLVCRAKQTNTEIGRQTNSMFGHRGVDVMFPRGITGFNVPKGHAEADPRNFRTDCWHVVAPLRGHVEDRQQVLDPRFTNFITQVLVLPGGEVTALLNKVHAWVGFCRPLEPGDCRLEFVDIDSVRNSFAALDRYRVFSRAELEQPVDESMCAELGHAELHQLKYWSKLDERKLRVGEVVFNFWD